MPKEDYIQVVIHEFRRLKKLADSAMAQVSDEQYFAVPGDGDNSIAIIVKHLGGNMLSRWTDFLTSDGEKPGRDRDTEFEQDAGDTRASLTRRWEDGWNALFSALQPLGELDLPRLVTIRGEPLSVLLAINRQLSHYAYHVGQIVYLAKHHCGSKWKTLSIPRGGSARFNQQPVKYVQPA